MRSTANHVAWGSRLGNALRRPGGPQAPRIGLLSACGWGNVGDAALLQAVIDEVRSRSEQSVICAFTLNPADTTARHGIAAYPISGHSNAEYRIANGRTSPRALRFQEYLSRVPLIGRVLRGGWELTRALLAEGRHVRLALARLRQLDLLVVAGGAQFDETRGGAWGHPYALFKWSVLARLTRTRFVILSVGVGSTASWLTRFFLAGALKRATYRSFRDAGSAQIAQQFSRGEAELVIPDLVLGQTRPLQRALPRDGMRLTVGVSPVAYGDPRADHGRDPGEYWRLMRVYAAFVTWLAEQGHTVVLFATDAADRGAVNDVQHRLRPDTLARYGMRIQHAYVDTVHGLVDELSRMDCVVASRLHTVILTHVLGLPVLAIAHDRKVLAHMNDLRQLRHCVEIEELETAELERGFADLNAWLPEAAATIYAATELCRRSVVAQYEHVFALTGWARERSRKPTLAAPARSLASADPVPRL